MARKASAPKARAQLAGKGRARGGAGAREPPASRPSEGWLTTVAGRWEGLEEAWGRGAHRLRVGPGRGKALVPRRAKRGGIPRAGLPQNENEDSAFHFDPQKAGNETTGEPAARAYWASEEVKQLRAKRPRATQGVAGQPRDPLSTEQRNCENFAHRDAVSVSQAPDSSARSLAGTLSELHHDLEDERLDSSKGRLPARKGLWKP